MTFFLHMVTFLCNSEAKVTSHTQAGSTRERFKAPLHQTSPSPSSGRGALESPSGPSNKKRPMAMGARQESLNCWEASTWWKKKTHSMTNPKNVARFFRNKNHFNWHYLILPISQCGFHDCWNHSMIDASTKKKTTKKSNHTCLIWKNLSSACSTSRHDLQCSTQIRSSKKSFVSLTHDFGVLHQKYPSPWEYQCTYQLYINRLQLFSKSPLQALKKCASLAHSLATTPLSSKKSNASPLPRAPSWDYPLLLPPNVAKALLAKDPHPVGNAESAYLQRFWAEAINDWHEIKAK